MHNQTTTRILVVSATVFVATALLTVAPTARADENIPGMKGAPNVAEMLQRRQESRLRDQLVRDGRWDEVRKLDEAQARRQHEQQQKIVTQLNDDLGRSAKSESAATTAIMDACDKETLRMRQLKSANAEKNVASGPAN